MSLAYPNQAHEGAPVKPARSYFFSAITTPATAASAATKPVIACQVLSGMLIPSAANAPAIAAHVLGSFSRAMMVLMVSFPQRQMRQKPTANTT